MQTIRAICQGDVAFRPSISKMSSEQVSRNLCPADPDGAVVLAYGETTGHRHRFAPSDGVVMYYDEAVAKTYPKVGDASLYTATIIVPEGGADLLHEEHGTIHFDAGIYDVGGQREHDFERDRVVRD